VSDSLLDVRDLRVHFQRDRGPPVKAVDGISFEVAPGEVLGIVGESGSGKSVSNMAMLRLVPSPPAKITGEVLFRGRDLLKLGPEDARKLRGRDVAMIFQDPMTSLNPLLRVSRQLTEGAVQHLGISEAKAREQALELLRAVGIPAPERRIDQWPHQFSGGMRQRIMIAMALMCEPSLLIADEPTTALDVTISAQILDLLRRINRERKTSIILITHDLGVVAGMARRVAVMYAGKIVELGPAKEVLKRPLHPYAQGLLASVPRIDHRRRDKLQPIGGSPPDLARVPSGCAFHPRCPFRFDRCVKEVPPLIEAEPGRTAACWLHEPGKPFAHGGAPQEASA
jgi:oligopeptide transport system ATP-binding protein